MANLFITPTMVARDAAITLANMLVLGNLVARDKESVFKGGKVGDSIKVTIPPSVTEASEFTGTTVATDVDESEIDLTLEHHFYKRADITTKQASLEMDDFTRTIIEPRMKGIQMSIDKYIGKQLQVFRKNIAGTVGNRPSTVAHIGAGSKALNDLFLRDDGRVGLIDTTVEQSLLAITTLTSADYVGPDYAAVRNASLGHRLGYDWVRNANLGAFVRSDVANSIAGTVLTNGTPAIGATEVPIDGITGATGTIYAGTVFTMAGDTTRYVVRKDATIAGNATTLTVAPALVAAPGDGALLTFEAAGYMNLLFHPNAVAAAIIAPEPLWGGNSVVQSYGGISVRVSQDSSISTLANSIVIDVLVGARVINPDGGCLICG